MREMLLLGACAILAAAPLPARQNSIPGGTPVGAPVRCIRLPIRGSRVRDDHTIDFFVAGRVYRNVLPRSCPGLGSAQAFSYGTSIGQLCSVDIITVVERTGGAFMQGTSCGLGPFQTMTGIR